MKTYDFGTGFAVYDETLGQYKALDTADVMKTTGEQRQDELHAISHAIDIARKLEQIRELLVCHSLVPHTVNESRVEFLVVKDSHKFHGGTGTGEAIGAALFNLAGGIAAEVENAARDLLIEARRELEKLNKGSD